MNSLFILVTSLMYSILLVCIYFYKKRLKSLENKLYVSLMITNFIGLLLDIASIFTVTYMDQVPILNSIVTKTYLVYLFTWATLFTVYVFAIARKTVNKMSASFKKNQKYLYIFFCLIVILIYILPLNYHIDNKGMYSYGIAANLLYLIISIYFVIWIIHLIINYRNLKSKKYLPIFSFLIFGFIVMIVQKLNPYLLLMTSMETFVTFLMYFTIENPDMQILREFQKSKEHIEKTSNDKTMFLLNVSQEMKMPLKQIDQKCQMVLSEENISIIKEEVRDISKYSKSLLNSINNVLDTSGMSSNNFKLYNTKYNTEIFFKKIVSSFNIKVKSTEVKFRTDISSEIPQYLYGDSIRLKQIIEIILDNALEHTKQGFIEFRINSIIKQDVCRLMIFVEDSGCGMTAEVMENIFDHINNSLGKAKKIINSLGGTIMVNSEPTKGSKFTVVIDQQIDVSNSDDMKRLNELANNYIQDQSVLMVSESKKDIDLISHVINSYGYELESVDLGTKCLEKVHKNQNYILILIDESISKTSADHVLDRLKQIDKFNIPVIILTEDDGEDAKKLYLKKGFEAYIQKPLKKKEIKMTLEEYLTKE